MSACMAYFRWGTFVVPATPWTPLSTSGFVSVPWSNLSASGFSAPHSRSSSWVCLRPPYMSNWFQGIRTLCTGAIMEWVALLASLWRGEVFSTRSYCLSCPLVPLSSRFCHPFSGDLATWVIPIELYLLFQLPNCIPRTPKPQILWLADSSHSTQSSMAC